MLYAGLSNMACFSCFYTDIGLFQWNLAKSTQLQSSPNHARNLMLEKPLQWGGMDYLGKEDVLTNPDLDRFVKNIWKKYVFCVYRKCFRPLSSAHEKWSKKQKCCIYIFVQYTLPKSPTLTILSKHWNSNWALSSVAGLSLQHFYPFYITKTSYVWMLQLNVCWRLTLFFMLLWDLLLTAEIWLVIVNCI